MMGKDAIDPPPEETEEATASPQQPQTWPPPVSMATPSTTTGSSRFRGHLIPNIVIDPIPPRDAFGHSHTPPFLQRSASDQPLSFRWSLGIPPGGGKKVRAHSDSAIMQLERHRDIPIDVQQEFQAAREFHHLPQPQTGSGSICRGEPRVTSSAVSLSVMDPAASSPKPMDTSNGSKQTVHSLSPHQQLMETSEYEGQNLPSPSFHSPTEKSPKTYWMRRHSDSNVPEGEAEPKEGVGLSISESSQSQRSHSAGDQDAQDPSKLSRSPTEGHKIFSMKKYLQERYILDKGLESGIGTVRIRHDSSDSGSQGSRPERPSTSEDRPSTTAASAPEVIERQTSSGFTVGQTSESQQETAEEPKEQYPPLPLRRHPKLTLKETVPLKTEPISPCESDVETPVFFSPSFISPRVFSESPRWHHVFQFPSARGRHMSPLATESRTVQQPHLRRSCSSSDVQLSVRGETPPPSETITRPEAMDQGEFTSQQHHQQQQHLHRPLQRSPIPRGVDPTRLSPPRYPGVGIRRPHRAVGRSRSEGHTPAHPLSPTPSSSFLISQDLSSGSTLSPSSMSSGSGSLPPFSTMVHQHSLPLSPGLTQPYTSYRGSSPTLSPRPFWSAGMPLSPSEVSPEREIGQQSAATYQSMPLSPPATSATVTSTGQSATTSGGGGRKMDASKMIYCPFGDKIREQRLTQDPGSVFRCPVCSQLFPSYYYLANHMVNHLPSEVVSKGPGDSNKIHLCKVCNRSFSRSDMLTRHMRLHTGLKPYECHICGQVFSRSDHLHTHARTHTGEKPYKCPQCPYAAPRRDMITRHMRIHAKHFSRRGRRTSSTSSDITPQSSTESVEVKRRNQSLSSIESIDSEPAAAYRTSTEHDVLREEEDTKTRNWSLTSGDSAESSEIIPSTTVSRNWSLASTESGEFQSRSYSLESSDYGSPRLLSSWLEAPPDTPSSISAEVQSSFQKCTVASDKESNDSSEKDNTLSPSSSVTMETDQKG